MGKHFARLCAAFLLALVLPLYAQEAPADPAKAVWKAANEAMLRGPNDVPLMDQATLHLPAGFGFVPRKEASAVMDLMGHTTGKAFIGLIFPLEKDKQWFASVDYTGEGYIKDDEARKWDAEELLDNLRKGTEQGNELREKKGVKPIEITGWIEKPAYDASSHRLVWSVGIKDKDAVAGDDNGVNYNTYVLGREGYIALDFISSASQIEAEKPVAQKLLAAIDFNSGRRYADFTESTDKVAEYGIAALVGGVVLKKIGLFAVAAAFFAKFFKLIAIAVLAVFAPLRKKLFGKKDA